MEKPHYVDHRERLKRHYAENGIAVLKDYEVVELLLFYAIPRREVKPLAKQLLARFGSLRGILDAEKEELLAVKGISHHSATLVLLIKDIIPLYLSELAKEKPQISCTSELLDYWRSRLGSLKEEHFCVIYLNAQNMVLGTETLGEGTVNSVYIHPRRIFARALKEGATAIIVVHNHPSGVTKPSEEDIRITKTLVQIGSSLDISLHDHIVVAYDRHFSFREAGIL
ncbi:MAG: DNA repair protein RadC [Deltaproteobacteria bacterium]|nr:DNA repair protein RadC [Deltaproteobacteria bacterium]